MLLKMSKGSAQRCVIALFAVLLLIPAMANAQERQIAEIKIVGNQRVSNQAIMAAMALSPGTAFSEEVVQNAKVAIESMGFFQPGVTVGVESMDAGVRLVFNVVENPLVREIRIEGNTVIETDKLLSLMRTSPNEVLNINTLENLDIPAIERHYWELGYRAFVTEEVGIDIETGVLTIPIMELRVEDINITGNNKTRTHVITREMQLKPGDVYNERVLAEDIRRIWNLGIFEPEGTGGAPPQPGSELGLVSLTVPVQERKTGEVSIGLGYSSRQKLVGQVRLSEANFQGRGQTVNLLWEQSGYRGSSYEAGFFEPWLDNRNTSLSVNVYNKLLFRFATGFLGAPGTGETDYDERRRGGSVTLSRPFDRTSRGFATLRSEEISTSRQELASPLRADGNVTSGTLRFTSDHRDWVQDPYAGAYNSYAFEIGNADFRIPGQDSENTLFTKYSVDLRRYFSTGGPRREANEERRRLAVRLTAGSLTGNVPFFEQYFVGGAESLRGFKEDRFWGRHMLLASAEYRVPVAQGLTGVAFVDFGDAWGAPEVFRLRTGETTVVDDEGEVIGTVPGQTDLIEGFPQHESFSPNLGYGLGIRVVTPIGPLRLDYGFSRDGYRAHFSIGHAF